MTWHTLIPSSCTRLSIRNGWSKSLRSRSTASAIRSGWPPAGFGSEGEIELWIDGKWSRSRARFRASLDLLTSQMEQSDRALRRDLEEVRREQDISAKTLGLLLVAMVALVLHLLTSLWAPGNIRRGADS